MIYWEDIKIAFSILSFQKIWNALLLNISFYVSRWMKKPIVWAYPMAISVEPTTACNLECPACPSGLREFSRPTGNMKEIVFQNIIFQLKEYLLHINFYFQGEPLIHPKIFEWVRIAAQNKIYTLISTNAHFIDEMSAQKLVESGLHKIIISIDGMTQSTYEKYRQKGNVQKVFQAIENIIAAKQSLQSTTPIIVLQWIVFDHNLNELPLFIEYCKDKKLRYQIKTAQVYSVEQLQTLVPKHSQYTRYDLTSTDKLKLQNPLYNHCWRMWASCVFTQNGAVVPCCFDKDAKYEMGDIKSRSFKEIWHSKEYDLFRKKILHHRSQIDICTNCSEGSKVFSES